MKEKIIYSLIYFLIIFIIGVIATHNENITTGLIINLWFSIPMTLMYCFEVFITKNITKGLYIIMGITNTIIIFIVMCALGSYILGKYMQISF